MPFGRSLWLSPATASQSASLGATNGLLNEDEDSLRPEEVNWLEEAPEGKLDLLINLEFRMTWYCTLFGYHTSDRYLV